MVGAQAVKFIWFVKNNVVAGKRIVAVACGYVQFPLVNTEKLPEIMGFTGKMIVAAILVVMYGHNFFNLDRGCQKNTSVFHHMSTSCGEDRAHLFLKSS